MAINPLLVKPVDQLRPDEVRYMQQRLSDWPDLGRYREANARVPAKQAGDQPAEDSEQQPREGAEGERRLAPDSLAVKR